MDKMTQILDIPSIKNDTNFWMVRAKRGFFFDEFIRNEFIAIGWNSVTKAKSLNECLAILFHNWAELYCG